MYSQNELERLNRSLVQQGLWDSILTKIFEKFHYGLSYKQLEKLTFELINQCSSIGYDIDEMIESYEYFKECGIKENSSLKHSISYCICGKYIGLSYQFNQAFSNIFIKYGCIFDKKAKLWLVPHHIVIKLLSELQDADADCQNAINAIIPHIDTFSELIAESNRKQKLDEAKIKENEVNFQGKSPTNCLGNFQKAQRKFHLLEQSLREKSRNQKKDRLKKLLKDTFRKH